MFLYEKYRPQTFDELVGQANAVATVRRIVEAPDFDRGAFWIVGPSGLGKTSLALLIARQFGSEFNTTELDGENCTVDAVRKIDETMRYSVLGGGFRTWIVNEAHTMTPRAVRAWLTTLERLPAKTLVLFTTTRDDDDLFGDAGGPFTSRVWPVRLTAQGATDALARRAKAIAAAEDLDGQPIAAYRRLVESHKSNMRAVIQAIQAGQALRPTQTTGRGAIVAPQASQCVQRGVNGTGTGPAKPSRASRPRSAGGSRRKRPEAPTAAPHPRSRQRPAWYRGECRACGSKIAVGDQVWYAKHYGMRCVECGPHPADDERLTRS